MGFPWIFYQNELLDSLFVQFASQVESLFCFISWPIPSINTIYTVHILIQMYAFPIFSVSFPMLRKPTCPKKMRETDHRFPEVLYKLTVFFGSLRLRSRVNQDRWKLFTEAFGDSSMLGQFGGSWKLSMSMGRCGSTKVYNCRLSLKP